MYWSDIITFHNYSWPVICTECMARPVGSTFDALLPIAKQERVPPRRSPYCQAEVDLIRQLTGAKSAERGRTSLR